MNRDNHGSPKCARSGTPRFVSVLVFALFATTSSLANEIYKWVDEDGTVHFEERAPDDVKSEQVHVDEAPATSSSYPNSTRSRELTAGRRAPPSSADSTVFHESEDAQRCGAALQQLSVLQVGLPTYRDEQGRFHNSANWLLDSYEGKRVYLDDAAMARAITRKKSEIHVSCASLGKSPAELESAGKKSRVQSENCKIASAELELLRKDSSRASPQDVRDKSRLVEEYCAE